MEEFAAVLQYSVPATVMAAIVMFLVGIVKLFVKDKYQSPWLSRLYFGLAIAFAFGVVAVQYALILKAPAFIGFVFYRDVASVVGLTQILYPIYRKYGGRKLFLAIVRLLKGKNADLDLIIAEVEKILGEEITMIEPQKEAVHKRLQELKEKV